ncbi:MAG TPA: M14 family metallocarboxypeptidase [Actinomycetota bacterium]|nr:M14 family metallocarboxypeptidase [Actinomycetota bacterium]
MIRRPALAISALALVASALASGAGASPVPGRDQPPQTAFEESNGESWTSHKQELEFLAAVDRMSKRVEVDVIGETQRGRPLHLVRLGYPRPDRLASSAEPTTLFVCSQHGNEPAGREACLKLLRDLAFTNDGGLVDQLRKQRILFVPSANPDGSAANTRENSKGIDINRDHLNLVSPEAYAVSTVVAEWEPEMVLDLHEYGPSLPPVYDDELLYLWPRNLNVDDQVHDLAKAFAEEHVEPKAEEAGYRADEYGQYELADQDIHQSAGDGDEGIARNAMGLRHSLGILIESAVTEDPRNGPQELTSEAEVNLRRVDSHMVVSNIALDFMRQRGGDIDIATAAARELAVREGRNQAGAVYFGGADNQEPAEEDVLEPPPCGYAVGKDQMKTVGDTLVGLGLKFDVDPKTGAGWVPMAQPLKTLIPLLLDERGTRHSVAAGPISNCAVASR